MSQVARPVVSVAICMHNGARYIAETLESVFAQSFQDFEVVIIDDGSTDGGAELIERRFPDPRLKIVRQSRQTLRGARPAVLAHARGEFAAFVDHDDLWLPDKLERQVEVARTTGAALVFSDCFIIDESGAVTGRLSHQFDFAAIDLSPERAYLELLRRGCFVAYPTAFARMDAVRAVGGFSRAYQYVSDYDLWLRLARHATLACIPEPLAKYRVHPTQFTQRSTDITLEEHGALLLPIMRSATYPHDVRAAIRDNLFGQHRVACAALAGQRRWRAAARAAAGMYRYPVGIRDYAGHVLGSGAVGPALKAAQTIARRSAREVRHAWMRAKRFPRWAKRRLRGAAPALDRPHIWIDGSSLGEAQTGYFALVSELIRRVAADAGAVVHVATTPRGESALRGRLGADVAGINMHPVSLIRRLPFPVGRPPHPDTTEVIVWRGRFRWRGSRRIAIVQDLTTKIHPELHTPANIAEFDLFLRYVQRHAERIATVSENSRRDIIERLPVSPASVYVLPMPVHPQYVDPVFDAQTPERHGITARYVLAVGTLEPRKNLRRLVTAFESLMADPAIGGLQLVLVGPAGWDPDFPAFVAGRAAAPNTRTLGFVPLEDLPSLYHGASAVVYPSLYEGFGLPVLEAMCSSAVVLTSNVSSLPEVLGAGGLTFDPYDTDAIARALGGALTLTPAAADEYRRRCRRQAERHLERVEHASWFPR